MRRQHEAFKELPDIRVGLRTNRRLGRQAVGQSVCIKIAARKSSRSFLPAAFGVLRIVRRPSLTISKEKTRRIHQCYAIRNKALRFHNGISVQSALNC
jgi:hypothetical protein